MAFHEHSGRTTRFFTINTFKVAETGEKICGICEKADVAQEGFIEGVTTNPQTNEQVTKYYHRYDGVEGYIRRVEWYDTAKTYEKRYLGHKIYMYDGPDEWVIDLPFDKSAWRAFTKFIENVDFDQKVLFAAWLDRKQDATAFGAKQGDGWVKRLYTKANPGDCPPPEEGLGKLDFRKQRVWLKERIDKYVIPAVEAAQAARDAVAVGPSTAASATTGKASAATANSTSADDPFDDELFNKPHTDAEAPTLAEDDSVPF